MANLITTIKQHVVTMLIGSIIPLAGAGYITVFKVEELRAQQIDEHTANEKNIEKLLSKIDKLQNEIEDLKMVVGKSQLDTSLICAEVVRARNGNPLVECKTMRGQ